MSTDTFSWIAVNSNTIITGELINFFSLQREDTTRELQFMFLLHPKPKPWRTIISCKRCLPDNMRKDNPQSPNPQQPHRNRKQHHCHHQTAEICEARARETTARHTASKSNQLATKRVLLHHQRLCKQHNCQYTPQGATAPMQRAPNHTTVRISRNQVCNNNPSAN